MASQLYAIKYYGISWICYQDATQINHRMSTVHGLQWQAILVVQATCNKGSKWRGETFICKNIMENRILGGCNLNWISKATDLCSTIRIFLVTLMRKGCTNILILTNNYVVLAPPYLITVRISKNLKFMGIQPSWQEGKCRFPPIKFLHWY